VSRKLPYRRYEELKSLAADLIEDYALSYPLDPFEIAATLGVHVTVHEFGLPLRHGFVARLMAIRRLSSPYTA